MVNRNAPAPQRLERLGLASVLLLAAWLRVWRVQANGFGNEYYAAAVRSMLQSAHNFFFVSFDPAGWVTVDKPPLALWIQALSAKIFGFGSLSILLPQAAEGVAGVAVLYALVRRRFDAAAALAAALALALMPVCVAVDRYNNVDACLVLVLLLAALAGLRAVERGGWAWTLATAALLGLGFNTKMLAAFTVLPAFFLTYALAAPGSAWSRARKLAVAGLVLALVALSWVATVDLTPAARRPYVGSTPDNSMLELSLGWNGLQRFSGRRRPAAEAGTHAAAEAALERTLAARRRAGGFRGGMGAGEPGPLRLAQPVMAGQVLWFLPLVLLGLCAASRQGRKGGSQGAGEEGPGRGTATAAGLGGRIRSACAGRPDRQALLLWTVWLFVCGAVLSALRVMHPYYLVLLAPPMAALCGIGLRALWLEHRAGDKALLPLALLLTALWQAATLAQTPVWSGALLPWLAGGSALGAWLLSRRTPGNAGVPASPARGSGAAGTRARVGFTLGFAALLLCPVAWALSPVLAPVGDHAVQADPALLTGSPTQTGGRMGARAAGPDRRLLAFLEGHRGTARYLVAADNSRAVGPLIIASGAPAIAVGGFMGSDPIVNVQQFAGLVQSGALRYFLLNPARAERQVRRGGPPNAGAWGPWGRGGRTQALDEWVRKHGSPVPPALWKTPEPVPLYQNAAARGGFFGGGQGLQLYDLDAAPRLGRRGGRGKW